jgi:RNA polymerase sigma-70 factor, ECF subfamily
MDNLTSPDDGLSAFLTVRHRLFGIACRMLHSAADAEDVVQDAWLRWQAADRTVVRDAAAFLVTTATRLSINAIQSARVRRETYVGSSPMHAIDPSEGPALQVERAQALKRGILALTTTLSPTERAAYILREAFDYRYRDIAIVLRLSEANARQVVTRARHRLASGRRPVVSVISRHRTDTSQAMSLAGQYVTTEYMTDGWQRRGRDHDTSRNRGGARRRPNADQAHRAQAGRAVA